MSGGKSVIVLGGSGETGRRIVDFLARRYPELRVVSAARRPQGAEVAGGNRATVQIDLLDRERALAVLARHDLAILAMGPMHAYGNLPHRLCLEAGIDCIDVNDSLEVADRVQALHRDALSARRTVLTGMGFTPGLSGLLLARLAEHGASAVGQYRIRAHMGAAYGGGESSPYAILASFRRHIEVVQDGGRQVRETPWRDGWHRFRFPGLKGEVDTIPFSAVEVASLTSGRSTLAGGVAGLDARYHIQYLKQGFARFLARFTLSTSMLDRLARMFHRSGQSMKRKKDADPDTVLWVYPDEAPERGLLVHGVLSSYDLTALMACAAADAWLQGDLDGCHGVFAVDQLGATVRNGLIAHLAGRGVTFKPADPKALADQGLDFGWVAPVSDGFAHSLRHYGCNWYTAPAHPKMVPLQKRFLLESDVWKALRERHSGFGLAGFVVSTMLRWRRHYRLLGKFRAGRQGPLEAKWALITRDISMFTSGYSRAGDVLGKAVAQELYGRMFLETGRMEMRWLWPDASVFAACARPWSAVQEYWLAFMAGCQELGVLRFDTVDHDDGIRCTIEHCAYAAMFSRLGCPELARLVREMECEALRYIAEPTGLRIDWVHGEEGTATITLRPPSDAAQWIHASRPREEQAQ